MRRPPAAGALTRAVDSVIAAAFPAWAVRRAAARRQLAQQEGARLAYEAARRDRTRSNARVGSADADLLPDLQTLRQRSRSLVRDDAHAAAAIRALVDNVVGCGLRPQAAARPQDTGLTQAQCDEWNAQVEAVWRRWAANQCDASRTCDFDELTRQVYRTRLVDGEALAHRVVRDGVSSWELLDVDRLQDPPQQQDDVRGGVQINAYGEPITYWVQPHHPDDQRFLRRLRTGNNQAIPISRFLGGWPNVLHLYRRERPGMSRGAPWITPALPLFDHLHHYLDSEIIAARANSNVAMVIRRPLDRTDPDLMAVTGDGSGDAPQPQYHQTIEPGTIEYLNEGEEMQPFTPSRPGSAFDPFVRRVLKAICASIGVSYELITRDFSESNYSSARASLLECRRGFEVEQNLMIAGWCRPTWETRVREAVETGELPKPRGWDDPEIGPVPYLASRWIRSAWGWVDPVKEIDAARLAVESNLSTPQHEASRAGLDVEEILEARAAFLVKAREIEERNKLTPGVLTATSGTAAPKPQPPAEQDPEDPEPSDDGDAEPDPEDAKEDDEEATSE